MGRGPRDARRIASASRRASATRTTKGSSTPTRRGCRWRRTLRTPTDRQFWSDTRLTFNAGKGIKATDACCGRRTRSIVLLQRTPAGAALAASAGIGPIGPERGRNLDVGIEQGMWSGRARVRVAYFDNEFFDLVEFGEPRTCCRSSAFRPTSRRPPGPSAYVNSQSFTAKGVETVGRRAGRPGSVSRPRITHLDADGHGVAVERRAHAVVQSGVSRHPDRQLQPAARPAALPASGEHRQPAGVVQRRDRPTVALSGYFAGKANDSTFLGGSDINFGNSLLLPNEDLNSGYPKMDLSGSYAFHRSLKWSSTLENFLNQHYEPAFGFPGAADQRADWGHLDVWRALNERNARAIDTSTAETKRTHCHEASRASRFASAMADQAAPMERPGRSCSCCSSPP